MLLTMFLVLCEGFRILFSYFGDWTPCQVINIWNTFWSVFLRFRGEIILSYLYEIGPRRKFYRNLARRG